MAKLKLIIGIGNPDPEYQDTRHNVGFMFVDYLAKKTDFSAKGGPSSGWEFEKKYNSFVSKTALRSLASGASRSKASGVILILAKPQTYVNKSGEAVKKLCSMFHIPYSMLIVIHDDLDIPFGNTKMSFDKNSGGHKGIESIMKSLKTKKFYRLRIGLATKALQKARQQSDKKRDEFVRNYVLSKFTKSESDKLKEVFREVYQKLLLVVSSK